MLCDERLQAEPYAWHETESSGVTVAGDVGVWDGVRFHYDDGATFKPTASGAYSLHGWTEVK